MTERSLSRDALLAMIEKAKEDARKPSPPIVVHPKIYERLTNNTKRKANE